MQFVLRYLFLNGCSRRLEDVDGFADKQNFHRQFNSDVGAGKHAVPQCVTLVPVIVLLILLLRLKDLVNQVNVY